MKKLLLLLSAVIIVLYLFGCSKEDSNPVNPDNPTLTGAWKGAASMSGFDLVFMDTDLSQSGASVSGSGAIKMVGVQDTFDCSVTGNNNYPNVSLTFQPNGQYQPLTFTGAFVNKDSLTGKLNGSGANNWDTKFKRQ